MTKMKKDEQELYMVAGSHLVKAGINPMTAAAIIRLGIAHRDMTAKLDETKDQSDKMDVFGIGIDHMMNIILAPFFHAAEATGMDVERMNSVLIGVMLGKSATGCILSTETTEDAKALFTSLQSIAFDHTVDITNMFKEHLNNLKKEKTNATVH
jgi:hypothetical protein